MLFTNALEKVFRPSNHKNRRGAERTPKTRKLQLESLETRQLLAVIYVDSLADPGVSGDTQTTLREAIAQANPGDVINFDSQILGGTIVLKSTLTINKSITIDGWNMPADESQPVASFAGITIDGSGIPYRTTASAPMVRVVNPSASATAPNIDVTVRGLTFTNTMTLSQAHPAMSVDTIDGIAILVARDSNTATNANLTVQNCTFTKLKYGGRGPIAFYGNTLKVANTLLVDNYALCSTCGYTGAVQFHGKAMTMDNCTVANNEAYNESFQSVNKGYGILSYAPSTSEVVVCNSIFVDHSAQDFFSQSAPLRLRNNIYEDYYNNGNIHFEGGNYDYNAYYPNPTTYSNLFLNKAAGNYRIFEESFAANKGNVDYMTEQNGYLPTTANYERAYDRDGVYRLKSPAPDYTADVGAYSLGWPMPQIIVTISYCNLLGVQCPLCSMQSRFCAPPRAPFPSF